MTIFGLRPESPISDAISGRSFDPLDLGGKLLIGFDPKVYKTL
jgi:hypothetical protein